MTRRLLIACSYKVFHGRIKRQEYLCETCHMYFSETYGTFSYRRKKPDLLEGVLDQQVRGVGVRDSTELVCVSKDTVEQVILNVSFRIEQWFKSLEIQIPKGNMEYDEIWTYVAKKQSDLKDEREMWLWI
ncbi:MAG TPA: IS1 family transposase, partial [Spirochaetes bacterium]|nr:IS1 family transposase [Spirochaetota bacterium]